MFFRENKKIIIQAIFGFLFIGLAFFFIRYQRAEIMRVKAILGNADLFWILAGMGVTVAFVILQGLAYSQSFKTIREEIPFMTGTKVYLKRFFISIFIPAGGVASIGFFTRDFERKHVPLTKTYFGSSIYALTSSFSLVLVALPVLFWALVRRNVFSNQLISMVLLVLFVVVVVFLVSSLLRKGIVYRIIMRFWPGMEKYLAEIRSVRLKKLPYSIVVIASVLVEFTGIFHLGIAMVALGFPLSPEAAVMGYITAMLFQVISPFMRGLGAIELGLSFVLSRYGFSTVDAISITLLYRFFAFWLPLMIGGLSFGFIRNKLLLRIVPVVLSFLMGIINIVTVLTPAVPERLSLLQEFMPASWFNLSGYLLMMTGLLLLVNSAFLLKGLRTAWFIAIIATVLSFAGHILAALNYQEALVSIVLIISLLFTRRQYFVRGNPLFGQVSIPTALLAVVAVLCYGIIGFYFLEEKYFNTNFSIGEAIQYTVTSFFLAGNGIPEPATGFARDFLSTLRISGSLAMAFLLYTVIRPRLRRSARQEEDRRSVLNLIRDYGNSFFDLTKSEPDTFWYFTPGKKGFLAYRVSGNYAIALENPVAPSEDEMKLCIQGFSTFCFDNGLRPFHFLVPEHSLHLYEELGKKHFLAARQAIVGLEDFTPRSLPAKIRNFMDDAGTRGYSVRIFPSLENDDIIRELEEIAEEFMAEEKDREARLPGAAFSREKVIQKTVMVVENPEGRKDAFLVVIPGQETGIAGFELLRKRSKASPEILEYLLAEFLLYLRRNHYKKANLGFAPMPGLTENDNFHHMSLKFAYEKICDFPPFRGRLELREQFNPEWQNLHVVYDHHYDLYDLPAVLKKVLR